MPEGVIRSIGAACCILGFNGAYEISRPMVCQRSRQQREWQSVK